MKKRIVIGLVGPISGGKGFLAEYLADHGFFCTILSDRIREEIGRRGLVATRKMLQDIGNELRTSCGSAVLVERSSQLIPEDETLVVIDGVRNPGEARFVKEQMGGFIIGVNTPIELRLRYYLERAKSRGEDGTTEADFRKANDRDQGVGENAMGQQGKATFEMSDCVVHNDGGDGMMRELGAWLLETHGINLE